MILEFVPQPDGDGGKQTLGGVEQLLPLVAASGHEVRIGADDQAFTGIVVGGDLGHIPLVEQRGLQCSALRGKLADAGRAQGGDPIEASWFDIGLELGLKRVRSLVIWAASVIGSAVFPSKTSAETVARRSSATTRPATIRP
jgi:hypothetical protein